MRFILALLLIFNPLLAQERSQSGRQLEAPRPMVFFSLGTPGGATIPSTLFQVITNIVDFKMSLRDALEYPRIHAATNVVEAEPGALVYDVAERLKQMGHSLNPALRSQGDVQAILLEEPNQWRVAWSDGRRGGSVKGY